MHVEIIPCHNLLFLELVQSAFFELSEGILLSEFSSRISEPRSSGGSHSTFDRMWTNEYEAKPFCVDSHSESIRAFTETAVIRLVRLYQINESVALLRENFDFKESKFNMKYV